jgi:uncharacterized membrane protein
MGLSPEDRQKIYEEEKARIEAREQIGKEKQQAAGSTTGLSPNAAGLLCYLGWWITGIIFLVLEQKNKWVRFHAAQSLVTFGAFTVAITILGWIPVVGAVFSSILSVAAFILWIILMVKAHHGERFKLPWAGEAAEKIISGSVVKEEEFSPPAPPSEPATPPPPTADLGQQISEKIEDYFKRKREGRIAESGFAIAWSIVLLIFFNFFNQYVAYYSSETVNGATIWHRYPFFTQDISLWLPILTATLILTIIGHAILITFDRYTLRETIMIVLGALGLATVATLAAIFPFDFTVIPNATAADATYIGVRVLLVLISIGIGIGIIVRLVKLMVNIVRQSPSY